jgi:hypothetical protein
MNRSNSSLWRRALSPPAILVHSTPTDVGVFHLNAFTEWKDELYDKTVLLINVVLYAPICCVGWFE